MCGLTGSGKTYILDKMPQHGAQVLDLESLANHRGSLLGEEWHEKLSPQPSQKYFETLLLQELEKLDFHQPVWVDSESQKIGKLYLPPSLWHKIKQGNCVEIQLPLTARIHFLLQAYAHLVTHPLIMVKGRKLVIKSKKPIPPTI